MSDIYDQRARELVDTVSMDCCMMPGLDPLHRAEKYIAAALREAAGEWRPIETAPRDGRPLRVKYSDGTEEDGVYWQKEGRHCVLGPRAGALPPGWTSAAIDHLPVDDITHWMPLPHPPIKEEG